MVKRKTLSPGARAMAKKSSKVYGARSLTAPQRMALVRAEALLDEAELLRAAHVETQRSDYPDTSWMSPQQLRAYREGRTAFYDTLLIDDTTGRVIDSLSESHVRDNATGEAYLKNIGLELVLNNKAPLIAAIKRKQGRRANPSRPKSHRGASARKRAVTKRGRR